MATSLEIEAVEQSNMMPLTAVSVAMMPFKTTHFAFVREETAVQLHGAGLWGIIYVTEANDPRKK